jgi:hypothetical protein
MFVTVQIPIADMRHFVTEETGRLTLPSWPLADPAKDFVRAVGPVRRRRRGGVPEWVGESLYCDARHALVFADHGTPRHQLTGQVHLTPLYRRFVATGRMKWPGAVARIDAGFRVSGRNANGRLTSRRLPLPAQAALAAVTVETRIPPNGKSRPMVQAGGLIAERIRAVTTSLTTPPAHHRSWWVQPGAPLVLVEAPFKPEWLPLLKPPMDVGTPAPGNNDALALHHFSRIEYQGSIIPVWTLFYSETIPTDTLRLLRIHLWRLHNEHEVLRLVLAACIQGQLDPAHPTLRDYLARQSSALRQPAREGFPQSGILFRAYAIDTLVHADYIEELNAILSDVSPGLAASVQPLIESKESSPAQALYIMNYGEVKVVENTDNRDFSQKVENSNVGAMFGGEAHVTVDKSNFQGSGTQNIQILDNVDMAKLADELARLVTELSQTAATPDQRADVELVRGAADAARQGDKKSVMGLLKRVGKWVLDNATQIGVGVAAAVIAAAI